MRGLIATGSVALALILLAGGAPAGGGDKPKYTIKEIMKQAQTSGLAKKVTTGKGNQADAAALLDYYKELARNTPPAGDKLEWKLRTDELIRAATAAVNGNANAGMLLKMTAMNCNKCHKEHKG